MDIFLSSPWHHITVQRENNCRNNDELETEDNVFYLKFNKTETTYCLIVTDMINVWITKVEQLEIDQQRKVSHCIYWYNVVLNSELSYNE